MEGVAIIDGYADPYQTAEFSADVWLDYEQGKIQFNIMQEEHWGHVSRVVIRSVCEYK